MKTHFLGFSGTLDNPLLGLVPGFVEAEEACLSATLDELIRLHDELRVEDPSWELGVGGDGTGLGIPGDLGDLDRGVDEFCCDLRGGIDGGGALEVIGEEELRVVLANRCVG